MADDHEVLVGLLDWVNSLQVAEEAHGAEDISDGSVVWKVLRMNICPHASHTAINNHQSRLTA